MTTPLRTLLDVADDPHVSKEQVTKATTDALAAGLVFSSALSEALKRASEPNKLSRIAAVGR